MKEEPSKYLELLEDYNSYGIKGRIYELIQKGISHGVKCNLKCDKYSPGDTLYIAAEKFKNSTKEAYEAQMEPKSRFDIGDTVDTDNTGYQYTEMNNLCKNSNYDWTQIKNCNCKTVNDKNLKVLKKAYSPYTNSWWYNVTQCGNWISENCMSLSEKRESKDVCEKQQDIISKETDMNYQYEVGDYVVCIGDTNRSKTGRLSMGWEKNLCFVVKKISEFSVLKVLWEGKNNCRVYEDQVRMATKEEVEEYKIKKNVSTINTKQDLQEIPTTKHQTPIIMVKKKNTSKLIIINK